MNDGTKQKWVERGHNGVLTLVLALALAIVMAPQSASADSLSGTTLSGAGSNGAFFFGPGTSAGDLSMTVTSCPGSQLAGGCGGTDAGITGSTTINGTIFNWQVLTSSSNLTPCAGTTGCWDFNSTTSGTQDWLIQPPGGLNQLESGGGVIAWSSITDTNGAITINGTATGTDPTGASVDDPFSVTLGTLTCTDQTGAAVTPCNLSEIANSDPIYGTASFADGTFGSSSGPTSATPEPSALILFGLGGLFLAGAAVMKRSWAGQQDHV